MLEAYVGKAELMLASDIKDNQAIGTFGADAIMQAKGFRVRELGEKA